jgi:hypothetical protein
MANFQNEVYNAQIKLTVVDFMGLNGVDQCRAIGPVN